METGEPGVLGEPVVKHVEVETSHEPDFATTLLLPMGELLVLGQVLNLHPVTHFCVQPVRNIFLCSN